MNTKKILNLFFLLMLLLFIIPACDDGHGGSYTETTAHESSASDILSGGTIDYNNGTITDENGNVVAYIDEAGTITDTNGNIIGYVKDGTITDASGNTIGSTDENGNITITSGNITLDDNITAAFFDEFIIHFTAGESSISDPTSSATDNIKYILTFLANNGVDNITSTNLASSFGRIVAEKVSDSNTCTSENSSLGCTLLTAIKEDNSTTFQESLDNYTSNFSDINLILLI